MEEQEAIKQITSFVIGEFGWLFIIAFIALAFKNIVSRAVEGVLFFFGKDYKEDDIVYIAGKKKARIARIGLTKTTFHLYDTHRKLVVQNTNLPSLMIEKHLPQNGQGKKES